jgi:acyl carrier protein
VLIKNDHSHIRAAVHQVILKLVQERGEAPTELSDDDKLGASLDLRSLDLAHLVFELELTFETDPFAKLVPITSVRTVGDLVAAYAQALGYGAAFDVSADILDAGQAGELRRRRRGLT